MIQNVYQRIAAATAAGDVQALAALAMELASTVTSLESLREDDIARRALQAERTRRHRNGKQRDVTLQNVAVRDSELPPPPPVGKEKGFIGSPPTPVTPNGVSRPAPRPRAAAVRPAEAGWVNDGVQLWESIAGAVSHGEFGKSLKSMVERHGWPAVRADLEKWLTDRVRDDRPCKPAWYAGEVTKRLAPKPKILNDDGTLTEYGERLSRPDKVPA